MRRRLALAVAFVLGGSCTQPNPAFREGAELGTGGTGGRAAMGGGPADAAGPGGGSGGSGELDGPGAAPESARPVDTAAPDDSRPVAGPIDASRDATSDSSPLPARRLSLAPGGSTGTHGDDNTAVGTSDGCPDDQMLVGFQVTPNGNPPTVGRLQAICGLVKVIPGVPYVITLSGQSMSSTYGGSGSNPVLVACPKDQVVVGLFGKADLALAQLGLHCAPLIAAADTGAVTLGAQISVGPAPAGATGTPFDDGCPTGLVANGYIVNYGAWIDALSFRCGRASLAP